MTRRFQSIFAVCILILFALPLWGMMTVSANITSNQPRPPERTPRPTQERNQPTISTPQPRATRDLSGYFDNLTAVVPSLTVEAYPTIDLTMPTDMPAWDEIDFSQLQLTLTWENPLETSPEAYSALVGFDNTYLGSGQAPSYAGMYTATGETSEIYSAVLAQLPAEVQSYLAIISGSDAVTYWGTYPAGVGILVIADCNISQCTQSYDSLQLQIAQASMGAYSTYKTGAPTNENEALSMIVSAYPLLGSATFYPYATETGYAFSAISNNVTRSSASVVGYYVGVIPAGGSSLVYVVVGIGDGSVAVMFP